ncbi:glycine betaine ABC transporter substrate-binding protein [Pelagibaculum spongiae]|uniref:Glycine/betaine ABC transporter substrate-binding protein n=1 Tax=Pelagibaculum spongiae TaxID=2080658 RepID=A0A2V1GY85_9GAMM|nr:glycine betaine ABC transporter substrate-binding protein [Pelagibaculum spongiae]PVZ72044.1 glycine/betaine ABC transporter substrate-binding protein [Pelagibaculum spongiae]
MSIKNKLLGLTAVIISSFMFSAQAAELVVGGKGFTEQLILASMTEQLLTAKGYDVDRRDGMPSSVLRKAHLNKQVDLYWEYTGTSLRTFHKIKDKMTRQQAYDTVKKLDGEKGIVWLNPSKANNTYALAVRKDDPNLADIKSISDMSAMMKTGKRLVLGSSSTFPVRADGLKPLQKVYDFKFKRSDIIKMDDGLTYQALKLEKVDIAVVFSTDGRIGAFNFRILTDDKNFFPDYSMVPIISADILEKHPKVGELLNQLSEKFDDTVISNLNAQVDVEKKSIERVATEFLKKQGLI